MTTYAMTVEGEVLDHVTIKQVRARFPELPEAADLDALALAYELSERDMVEEIGVFPVADPVEPPPQLAEGEEIDLSPPVEREDGSWGRDWVVNRCVEIFTPGKRYARLNGEQRSYPFRRRRRPRKEVINDISADVVTVFRLLQRHYQQLLDVMKWQVCSRSEFERLVSTDPATLTDLERAVRFIYLQRTAFGGKVRGQNYGISFEGSARFDLTKLVPVLEDVHERLCGVDIERLPYEALVARYDRPGTLFYLDPPYHGCEDDYGLGVFSATDFDRLRGLLEAIEGRFILSINDTPEIRAIFAGFDIEEVGLNYRVSGKVTPARELIITGGEG